MGHSDDEHMVRLNGVKNSVREYTSKSAAHFVSSEDPPAFWCLADKGDSVLNAGDEAQVESGC